MSPPLHVSSVPSVYGDDEPAGDHVAPVRAWHASSSRPWSSGAMSVPAPRLKYSPPIGPYPVASPKSVDLAGHGRRGRRS